MAKQINSVNRTEEKTVQPALAGGGGWEAGWVWSTLEIALAASTMHAYPKLLS